jgi:hypothetical protein
MNQRLGGRGAQDGNVLNRALNSRDKQTKENDIPHALQS